MLKLHLDENVEPEIACGLRRRGVDLTTTREAGLESAPDESHIAHGRREQRVVFTYDKDFLRLRTMEHHGVIFCASSKRTVGEVIEALEIFATLGDPEDARNRVIFL